MDTVFELLRNSDQHMMAEARREVLACNEFLFEYGLSLSMEDVGLLVEGRQEALKKSGRVEFEGGILPKLIEAFCDSPYLEQDTFTETLLELMEAFYYYKSESMDLYTDEELIDFMVSVFNGRAQGSAEYLTATSIDALCRYARAGFDAMDADEMGDYF